MTPRSVLIPLILVIASVALAACGGGDDEETTPGNLTNPRDVPTSTPWPSPPEVVVIDPNAIQPLPAQGTPVPTAGPSGAASPSAAAGTCESTYTLVSGDNFSLIAEKCGTTTQALVDANPDKDPRGLHPGDVINIPQ
jgi:LysM repeat protein